MKTHKALIRDGAHGYRGRHFVFWALMTFVLLLTATGQAQDRAEEQFNFAKNLFKDGMYSIAGEQFRQFAENNPTHVRADEAQFMVAECFYADSEWKQAANAYKSFLAGYPSSKFVTQAWYNLGDAQVKRSFFEEAVEAFDHLYKRYPGSEEAPLAASRIGECYVQLEAYPQALQAYERFLKDYANHPLLPSILFEVGMLYSQLEDWDAADETFARIATEYPKHDTAIRALLEQANVLRLSEKYEQARTAYESFLQKYPKSDYADNAQLGIGIVLLELGQHQEAITELNKLITLYPFSELKDNALYQIAEAWRLRKNYHEARVNYEDLIRNYPRSEYLASAQYGLALTLAEEGRVYAAIEHFEKLVQHFPNTEFARSAQLQIAKTHIEKGQFLNGVRAYRQYLADNPELPVSERVAKMFEIGKVLENQVQHYDMAVSAYQDIMLQYPEHARAPEAMIAAARCYEKLENYSAARREYTDLMDKYPNSPQFLHAQARIAFIDDYLLREYDDALEVLSSGLVDVINEQVGPSDLYRMAHVFDAKLRMYAEAARLFEAFFKRYPHAPEAVEARFYAANAYDKLAHRRLNQDAVSDARSYFQQARTLYQDVVNRAGMGSLLNQAAAQLVRYDLREMEQQRPKPYAGMANACRVFIQKYPNSDEQDWAMFTLGKVLVDQYEAGQNDGREAEQVLNRLTMEYSESAYAPEGYLLLGRLAELRNETAKAAALYQQIVDYFATSPVMPQALYQAGKLQQQQGKNVEAVQSFERLGQDYPFHDKADEAWLDAASCYIEIQNYPEAINAYSRLKGAYPDNEHLPEAEFQVGRVLRLSGRYADSNAQLNYFIDTFPGNSHVEQAYLLVAENYQAQGLPEMAVKTLNNLVEKYPSLSVRLKVADLQFDTGNYDDALTAYQALLKNDPEPSLKARILYQLARTHFRLNHIESARKAADDFHDDYSDRLEERAHLDLELADYYLRQKQFDRAREIYDSVRKNYPQTTAYAEAQYGLGMYYFSIGDFANSIPIFESVARNFQGQEISRQAYFRLGTALYNEQRFDAAVAAYQQIVQQDDRLKYPEAHFNLALAQEKAEMWQDAAATYRRFVEKLPDHELAGRAYFKIGYCLFSDGRYREAVDALRFSLAKVEGDDKAEALYWLGESYFNLSDYQNAAIELLKVPYMYPNAMDGMWAVTAEFKAAVAHEKMGEYVEATRLYSKIIDKYGRDSRWGNAARERLDQMGSN